MPSVNQKRLYNSVKVFWLDKDQLKLNSANAVNNLVHTCDEVKKVILFGSVAENRGLPSSDVDTLIVVSESKHRFLDRIPQYQNYFDKVGLGVDLFVYTEEEIKENTIPLVSSAIQKGKILFKREST